MQNLIKKNKNFDQIIGVKYFYALFLKKKKVYPPSFFCVSKGSKAKRNKRVEYSVYRAIISEFFKMYFFEFFSINKSMYFPFGGFLKKVIYPTWKGKNNSGGDRSIGLFWYMRATNRILFMVKLKKLTGKHNQIPKLQRLYSSLYDKDLLPIFSNEFKEALKNKTLYLCSRN